MFQVSISDEARRNTNTCYVTDQWALHEREGSRDGEYELVPTGSENGWWEYACIESLFLDIKTYCRRPLYGVTLLFLILGEGEGGEGEGEREREREEGGNPG